MATDGRLLMFVLVVDVWLQLLSSCSAQNPSMQTSLREAESDVAPSTADVSGNTWSKADTVNDVQEEEADDWPGSSSRPKRFRRSLALVTNAMSCSLQRHILLNSTFRRNRPEIHDCSCTTTETSANITCALVPGREEYGKEKVRYEIQQWARTGFAGYLQLTYHCSEEGVSCQAPPSDCLCSSSELITLLLAVRNQFALCCSATALQVHVNKSAENCHCSQTSRRRG